MEDLSPSKNFSDITIHYYNLIGYFIENINLTNRSLLHLQAVCSVRPLKMSGDCLEHDQQDLMTMNQFRSFACENCIEWKHPEFDSDRNGHQPDFVVVW